MYKWFRATLFVDEGRGYVCLVARATRKKAHICDRLARSPSATDFVNKKDRTDITDGSVLHCSLPLQGNPYPIGTMVSRHILQRRTS